MGENVPPILGEYGGLNLGVMEELGYTVRKKDENGDPVDEIDWKRPERFRYEAIIFIST